MAAAVLAAVFAPGHVEDWFTANGSPISSLDEAQTPDHILSNE
jgi:hypothetical protein